MSEEHVTESDGLESIAEAPAPQSSDRRRYFMDGSRLDGVLWAAGYRLCDRCDGLTIHRLVCLKCDPTDASRIEPVPQEDVA